MMCHHPFSSWWLMALMLRCGFASGATFGMLYSGYGCDVHWYSAKGLITLASRKLCHVRDGSNLRVFRARSARLRSMARGEGAGGGDRPAALAGGKRPALA